MHAQQWVDNEKISYSKNYRLLMMKYDTLVKSLAKVVVRKYYSLPVTWEDVYIEACFNLVKIYNDYDSTLNDNIDVYMTISLTYFMRNYCRKWLSKKHLVLNNSVEYKEEWSIGTSSEEVIFYDHHWLDKFDKEEQDIINLLVNTDKNNKQICQEINISRYKFKQKIQNIKKKLVK